MRPAKTRICMFCGKRRKDVVRRMCDPCRVSCDARTASTNLARQDVSRLVAAETKIVKAINALKIAIFRYEAGKARALRGAVALQENLGVVRASLKRLRETGQLPDDGKRQQD